MQFTSSIDKAQERSLRVLEWPLVQAKALGMCQWLGGQEVLLTFVPLDDIEELQIRQQLVTEAIRLEGEGNGRGMGGMADPRPSLEAALKAKVLSPEELLEIEALLAIAREIQLQFKGRKTDLPRLADLVEAVLGYPRLEDRLRRSINRDAKVSDEASSALRRIRSEVREAEDRLQRALQNLLRSPELAKAYQEPIVTQRQGRFVIPVKAEYRSRFPGLVIDSSASGATVFMEPFVAVSLGNELRQKVLAEEREVQRILAELSALVAEHSPSLLRASAALARLDAYLGLARYYFRLEGCLPNVSLDGELRLRRAHHPLLGSDSVPIDIELAGSVRGLVITGPNTGGKTVALKTVGLLAIMASSGYPIPASHQSTLPLITRVWADIGDEQSLAQSLSTFSAHLVHILDILKHVDGRSLVLLDELGAGTDPAEGGALGVALLKELERRGARTIVSTHLPQLKVLAKKLDSFENAAVEFDATTLRPTYRILMGIPGRSNALAIAAGLGLPEEILREARSFLGGGFQSVEHLLDDLEVERQMVSANRLKLDEERSRLEDTRAKLEVEIEELNLRKEVELEEARFSAERLLEETRLKTKAIFKEFQHEIEQASNERKEALLQARRLARQWAERARGNLVPEDSLLHYGSSQVREDEIAFDFLGDEARAAARKAELELETERKALALERRQERKKNKASQPKAAKPKQLANEGTSKFQAGPKQLASGTRVFCSKLGQEAVVLEQKGRRVDVKLGALKMSFDRGELEVFSDQTVAVQALDPVVVRDVLPSARMDSFPISLNLRGQTTDMALFELDKYLDRAMRTGVDRVEILHGKGTGALRQAIQQSLKANPAVADFRDGGQGEGSWGVTIVSLRV